MRSATYKGRCIKKKLKKSEGVIKLYDNLQVVYADILDSDPNISQITANMYLQDLPEGEFTSDFVCTKTNGELMVRECVYRKKLTLPRTCKLLDVSRLYWLKHGVEDWGLILDKESADEQE